MFPHVCRPWVTLGGSLSSQKPSHSGPTCFRGLCLCPSEYLSYFPLQWHVAMRNTRLLHYGTSSPRDRNEGRYYTNPFHLLIMCVRFCFECYLLYDGVAPHIALTFTKGCARLWSHLLSNLFVLSHHSWPHSEQKVGHYQESSAVSLSHRHNDSLPVRNLLILNYFIITACAKNA